MTPDASLDPLTEPKPIQHPSTVGMTTKVVKGSMWSLAAQVAPLFATLISTPVTIRLLGDEGYGVLILVGLIPMYFAFADLGMGVASTRFGAAAYGEGDSNREAQIVWTAAAIALLTSLVFAGPIFLFASSIIDFLNVPAALTFEGTVALRISTVAFVVSLLGNIFNTPQLSRLRMDLNSLISGGSRILASIAAPIVIFFGGGIIGAATATLIIVIFALCAHVAVSGRLLQPLFRISFTRTLLKPMTVFGFGLLISGIAAQVLVHFDKISLPRLVSIQALAYYSVAFTFANMATMFSSAMVQSLIPAFSQLGAPEKRRQLQSLFSRSVRINLIVILPALMVMFVVAEPFFGLWAGESFARESTGPFRILLLGLLFNLLAYVPISALMAAGRTDIFAKLYWVEAVFYVIAVILFVRWFQIQGAALAWTLRAIIDTCLMVFLVKRFVGLSFGFRIYFIGPLVGAIVLSAPIIFAILYGSFSYWLFPVALICLFIYLIVIWKAALAEEEIAWVMAMAKGLRTRFI